jgi:replication initiation and membrane attachment protein DnaB
VSHVTIDSYVLETLMADLVGHDRLPSAFIVYLFLWHQAARDNGWTVALSHRAIADGTGLSRRIVQTAIHHLLRRKLLTAERESITAVPRYTVGRPWIRPPRG